VAAFVLLEIANRVAKCFAPANFVNML